jgi:nucleotide-binding universal stress UspA family protein
MTLSIIVSYDGTANDDDALALARMLAPTGASLALAYVRHSLEYDPKREEIGSHDADRRLQQGAVWLDDPEIARHVVIDPSTSAGLARLAEEQGASLILFGSDYRTPPGRVEPGGAAQGLLTGGTTAIGVAAAGLRIKPGAKITTIAVAGDDAEGAAQLTAGSLASALGAEIVAGFDADLILVDSQSAAREGTIALGGATRSQLDSAHGSVIVLPVKSPLSF